MKDCFRLIIKSYSLEEVKVSRHSRIQEAQASVWWIDKNKV